MIEDIDGFMFRRAAQTECTKRKQVDSTDDPGMFTFKFMKSSRRMSIEVKNGLRLEFKRTRREDGIETAEDARCGNEEVLQSSMVITGEHPLAAFDGTADVENLSNTFIVKEISTRAGGRTELHERLENGADVDDLMRLCVAEVSKSRKTAYAASLQEALLRHGIAGRRDVQREVEEAKERIAWARGEERRWEDVKKSVLDSNRLRVRDVQEAGAEFDMREIEAADQEFAQKRERLEFLKEAAKLRIQHIKEQSEGLLRKIFDIVHKGNGVDAFFLLRALSKVCK
jgi:hypothetical protein